uniref:Uncharacterized protein n=1 Tax=Myoviridae sp. ctoNH1 TaxID=2826695 RepID=A0A8S5QSP0_9CAUD|nr:MAG TPA: hypothetical protein [Myoviridae sp. ctoNH1]
MIRYINHFLFWFVQYIWERSDNLIAASLFNYGAIRQINGTCILRNLLK